MAARILPKSRQPFNVLTSIVAGASARLRRVVDLKWIQDTRPSSFEVMFE
jgi:hypothetical protein